MTFWTPKLVEARLAEAVSMFGLSNVERSQPPCPFSVEKGNSDAALLWLLWLQPEDAQLLWMRVERTPWKDICEHFRISRATANRRVEYLLSVIAWKLNNDRLPKCSQRFVVKRTRLLSSDT